MDFSQNVIITVTKSVHTKMVASVRTLLLKPPQLPYLAKIPKEYLEETLNCLGIYHKIKTKSKENIQSKIFSL